MSWYENSTEFRPKASTPVALVIAARGMFYQDGLTGSAWGDWANYTDSPLRADATDFSKEMG